MRKMGMLVSLAAAFALVFAASMSLTKEGTHLLPEGVTSFVKIGNYIYTAAGNWGVVIYDVSDSSNIVQAGVWRADESDFTAQTVTEVLNRSGKLVVVHQGPGFEVSILDLSSPTNPTLIGHVTDRMLFHSHANPVVHCADIWGNILAMGIDSAGTGQGGVMLVNTTDPHFPIFGSVWWGESGYNIEDIISYSKYIIITQWNSSSSSGRIVSLEYDDVNGSFINQKYTYVLGGTHPYGIARGISRGDTLYFYVALGPNGVGTYKLRNDGTIVPVGAAWAKTDTTDDVRNLFAYGDRLFICNFESDTTNITGIIVAPIDTTTWMPTDTVAVYPARYVRAAWADSNRVYFIGDMSKGSGTAPGAR